MNQHDPHELTKEERILRMVKRVLTDIAKETYAPPGMQSVLSDNTIQGLRECFGLIAAREREMAEERGQPSRARPHYVDEPQKNVVVPIKKIGKRKVEDSDGGNGD
jgi:hypothetical protein